jgi:GNAT superfamily N-acetyltransferase
VPGPDARLRGHARVLLAELERTAAAAGRRRMVLETGTRQPEAIALYTPAGYPAVPEFGLYGECESSRCYGKTL